MTREVDVGVIVEVKDKASAGFNKIKGSAEGASKGISDLAKKGTKGLRDLIGTLADVNLVFELGGRIWEKASFALESFVTNALEQRAESDRQRISMEKLGDTISRLLGLMGDLLIPVILGVADALGPTIRKTEEYLSKNRELIGSGITEFLVNTARLLTSAVGRALVLVTRIWNGWRVLITTTQSAISGMFASLLNGASSALSTVGELADKFGLEGLAAKVISARKEIQLLSSTFQDSSDNMLADSADIIKSQEDIEKQIAEVEKLIQKGIGVAAIKVMDRFRESIDKIPPRFEELKKKAREAFLEMIKLQTESLARQELAAVRQRELADLVAEVRINRLTMVAEAEDRAFERTKERAEETANAIMNIYDGIRSSITDSFADIGRLQNKVVFDIVRNEEGLLEEQERIVEQHVKTLGNAFEQMVASFAKKVAEAGEAFLAQKLIEQAVQAFTSKKNISANAAEGASAAFKAHAGIPFVGLALGAAAAAAMFAAIIAFAGKFQEGGIVKGGVPGRDSAIILAEPEEAVLPVQMVRDLRRVLGAGSTGTGPTPVRAAPVPRFQNGGIVSPQSTSVGDTFVFNQLIPPSRAEFRRVTRDRIIPGTRDLKRLGIKT